MRIGAPKFIDTPSKKRLIFSFVMFNPILSLLVGAPIPFPSVMDVTPDQIAIFNFASLLITIMGSMTGVGFYLERRNNLKIEVHNKKIDTINEHIEKVSNLNRDDMKDYRGDMNLMEKRICDTFGERLEAMQKNALLEVERARELADQRITHLHESMVEIRQDIQAMERNYQRSDRYTRQSTKSKRNDAIEDDIREEKKEQQEEEENDNDGR